MYSGALRRRQKRSWRRRSQEERGQGELGEEEPGFNCRVYESTVTCIYGTAKEKEKETGGGGGGGGGETGNFRVFLAKEGKEGGGGRDGREKNQHVCGLFTTLGARYDSVAHHVCLMEVPVYFCAFHFEWKLMATVFIFQQWLRWAMLRPADYYI